MSVSHADVEILAKTIYGEARGEGIAGMEAVACVVLARAADGRWPSTVAEVCLQPKQFSCWGKADANRSRLLSLSLSDEVYRRCYAVAAAAVAGLVEDRTDRANHYLVSTLIPKVSWARGQEETCRIGAHSFFRL